MNEISACWSNLKHPLFSLWMLFLCSSIHIWSAWFCQEVCVDVGLRVIVVATQITSVHMSFSSGWNCSLPSTHRHASLCVLVCLDCPLFCLQRWSHSHWNRVRLFKGFKKKKKKVYESSNIFSIPHRWSLLFQGLGTNTGLCYGSYVTPMGHGMNLVQTDGLPSTQVLVPGSPPIAAQSSSSCTSSSSSSSSTTSTSSSSSSSQKLQWPDKLEVFFLFLFYPTTKERVKALPKRQNPSWCLCQRSPKVCREFQRGNCARGEMDCRFAHPSDSPMIDTADNTVTVCMDYIKSRCSREKCKYFHPPAHLQAKIKSSQQQISQTAAAGQTASVVRHRCPSVCVDVLAICCLSVSSL